MAATPSTLQMPITLEQFPLSTKRPSSSLPILQQPNSLNPVDALIHCLQEATSQGRFPAKTTFISAMKSCSTSGAVSEGQSIHANIIKFGFGADRFIAGSIIGFYSSCGHLGAVRKVFDGVLEKDVSLYTSILKGYLDNGEIEKAKILFEEMPTRDVVAWNAMISGLTHSGFPEDALDILMEMQQSEVGLNEVTLVSALSACSQMGSLALGSWMHAYIDRHLDIGTCPALSNSLVNMYAKCGRLDVALDLFLAKEHNNNLESWNTMLSNLAIHGCGIGALSLFSQMIKIGLSPDRITFVGLLMACSHSGMVDHAHRCFSFMTRVYSLESKAEHYGCLVDVLSRRGYLDEAWMLIGSMPFEPDIYAWGALFNGCFTHCNFELGLEAARHLIELEPKQESRYTALLNLLARHGRMEDAVELRNMMTDSGIRQTPGISVIEVDGIVHEFLSGDRSHCQSRDIYLMIEIIALSLELHKQLQ